MDIIATDIVLIPPKRITQKCINLNSEAWDLGKGRFQMGYNDYIPHISLNLGTMKKKDIPLLKKDLELYDFSPIHISIEGTGNYQRDDGNRLFLKIDISKELRKIHEDMVLIFSKYRVPCASKNAFYKWEETDIAQTSFDFQNFYHERNSFENYHPHITLCCYEDEKLKIDLGYPINFETTTLGLFQVGNGNTCRRKLWVKK